MSPALMQWAARHGVTAAALADLMALYRLGGECLRLPAGAGESEGAAQAVVRLEAARAGVYLFRNNVGVLKDETGRPVRYGLANDSAQVNAMIKSGDLIGIRPVRIGAEHVGQVIGQFVSREIKRPGWRYTGTPREEAQLRWAELVMSVGGDACFATGAGTL